MIRARLSSVAAAAAALALAVLAGAAALRAPAARAGDAGEDAELDTRVFLDQDPDAAGLVRIARAAGESGKWQLAIEKYLEAARRYGNTVVGGGERLYLPVHALVRAELMGMPKEGRELYRVLKSREAEQACERALAEGDEAALARVVAEYPGLEAAPRALYLLGERARARGDLGRAIFCWRRLLHEYPDWEGRRVPLLARALTTALDGGRFSEAAELLRELRKVSALARLRIAGREVAVAEAAEKALRSGSAALHLPGAESGAWTSIGGDGAHARASALPPENLVRRWRVKPPAAAAASLRGIAAARGRPAPAAGLGASPRHPVCAAGFVFLAGDSGVCALRAVSGQVAWTAPANASWEKALAASRAALPTIGEGRVYVTLGQPLPPQHYRRERAVPPGLRRPALHAYGLESGKLLWIGAARGADKDAAKFLAEIDLTGTPVFSSGKVYCPAVKSGQTMGDAYVACFDAASGELLWRTFVCAGYPVGRVGYGNAPRTDGQPPAADQGVVAFVSNLGAVAALEGATGQLLWLYLYDRLEPPGRDRFGRVTAAGAAGQSPSWTGAPVISAGVLYAAPQDGPDLIALELASGRLLWKARVGPEMRIVGLSGDRLVLAGGRNVLAFSAATGKRLWRGLLDGGESGLGLLGGELALIPTPKGLQRFSLGNGKLLGAIPFQEGQLEAGNLVVSGDVLVTSGPGAASGYFSWDLVLGKLEAQIAADPQAAAPRAEKGELHRCVGKDRQAIGFFLEALERAKPGEVWSGRPLAAAVKRQVWECRSQLGEYGERHRRYAEALEDYVQAQRFAQSPPEEMLGYLRQARCHEALENWPAAVVQYQQAIARVPEETYEQESSRMLAGLFARSRIERIIKAQGREPYARFDAQAAELLARAAEGKDAALAARVLKEYPNSASASGATVLLGDLAMAAGRPAEAAAHLREHLIQLPGDRREVEIRARLALAYKAQGLNSLSKATLERLLQVAGKGEQRFELGGRAWTAREFVAAHLAGGPGLPLLAAGAPLPDLSPPLEKAWEASVGGGNAVILPAPGTAALSGCIFVRVNANSVTAIDAETGKRRWRANELPPYNPHQTTPGLVAGQTVLVPGTEGLVALAADSGKRLWEARPVAAPQAAPVPPGMPAGMLQMQRMLVAADDGVVAVAGSHTSREGNRNTWQTTLRVYEEATGQEISSRTLENRMCESLLMARGKVLIGGRDVIQGRNNEITAVEVSDASVAYVIKADRGLPVLHAVGGRLLAVDPKGISCYDLAGGKLLWNAARGGAQSVTLLAADESRLIAVAAETQRRGGRLPSLSPFAVDMATGKQLWAAGDAKGAPMTFTGTTTQTVAGRPPLVVEEVPSDLGKVTLHVNNPWAGKVSLATLDGESGRMLWGSELPRGSNLLGHLRGTGHVAAVITRPRARPELHVWDLATGKLVQVQPAEPAPLLNCGGRLIQVYRGKICCWRSAAGGRPAAPEPAPAAPDGEGPGE